MTDDEILALVDTVWDSIADISSNMKLTVLGVCAVMVIQHMAENRRDAAYGHFVRLMGLRIMENPSDDDDEPRL